MRLALKLHPDSQPTAARHVDVDVVRSPESVLSLRYLVTGPIGELALPGPAPATRADELWKHTCFEVFIGAGAGQGYCEFNFSPSSQWAAYRFGSYRRGMTNISQISAPTIAVHADGERVELHAVLDLGLLPDLPLIAAWRVGLTAVIEDKADGRAYWALVHPPGKPDFHQADGFACQVSVAEPS